jgi:hypothetical protein
MRTFLLIGDVFPIIYAFALQTNGVRRKELLDFGKKGTVVFFLLTIFASVYFKEYWFATYLLEALIVFAVANLIFSVMFRKVRKN